MLPLDFQADLQVYFQAFPKTELHLHLDCSLSYDVVRTLDPTVTLAEYQDKFSAPARCTNLADFLTRPPRSISLMQTEEQLRLVTFDVFAQLKRDNLYYTELRFAPFLHTEKGLSPTHVVAIVNEATAQASRESGVEARLILCTLRHFSAQQSMQTVQLVERFQGTHVAALDIAGDEAGFPLVDHLAAFRYAQEKGLPRTAHAGEGSGPESVWQTLKHLKPSRIGHGARSSEDTDLIAYVKQQQIHLEVCPSSNLQTNMYATYADHPINELYTDGVSLSVNTDTRTITNITLTQEYERLHKAFGWDAQHFLTCNLHALQASFLPADVKQQVEARLRAGYAAL
jgi:adenosine deaminase